MNRRVNHRQTIWMIAAVMFAAAILPVSAQGQSQWETSGVNIYYNAGNVGIGTASPSQKLHVASGNIRLDDGAALVWGGTTNWIEGSNASNYLKFATNNLYRMTIDPSGNVGIGTTSPFAKFAVYAAPSTTLPLLQLASTSSLANNDILRVQINGLTNGLRMFQDASSNVVYSFEGGNVGVGTTTPLAKFDITTTADTLANLKANISSNGLNFNSVYDNSKYAPGITWTPTNLSTIHPAAGIWAFMGGGGSSLQFGTSNTYGGITNTAMTIDYAGNVGIGTTSPAAALDVNGAVRIGNTSSGHGMLTLKTTSNDKYSYINFGADSGYGWQIGKDINSGGLGGANGLYIYDFSNSATRMAFNTNGNVGIGTVTPGYKLDVNGEINATGLRINGTPISSGGGSSQWSGTSSIYYDGGNVGIGTNNPNVGRLQVAGAANSWSGYLLGSSTSGQSYGMLIDAGTNASDNAFRVRSQAGAEHLIVRGDGNVGIGTTTPGEKLQVNGGLSVSGAYGGSGAGLVFSKESTFTNIQSYGGLPLRINDAGNNVLFTGGNVGIGTPSPGARLSIAGSSVDTGSTGIDFTNTNGNTFRLAAGIPGITNSNFSISQGGAAEVVVANGSGNVGIGLNDPGSYKLNVNGEINATGLRINGTPISTGSSQWANGSGSISYSDGNVGIGTPNPGTKLQVNGDILTNGGEARLALAQNETATRLLSYSNASSLWMLQPTTQRFVLADSLDWDRGVNFQYTAGATGAQAGELSIGQLSKNSSNFTHGTTTLYTNGAERLRINSLGNVGIGTTSPSRKLEVVSDTTDPFFFNGTYNKFKADQGWTYLESFHGAEIVIDSSGSYDDRTFTISKRASRIGGGTPTPIFTVSENGNVNITGSINAKYQDVAEWVASSEQLAAGTVVVLDSTKSNQVISSSQSYDTRVAGVISLQPGITLGEQGDDKVLVATTGRVKVKVDASKGPIHIGDLLVTSDVPGVAMKSEPVELGGRKMHMPGTLIGKALEPLEKGSGEILVLLSLQ